MGVQIVLCGTGLLVLMLGLIFKDNFRKDMLAGRGQASFLRVFSVKGAAILVLAGLLLVGFLYPTYQLNLVDKLEKKDNALQQVRNELDQIGAVWKITGELHPDQVLGDSNVWVFSQLPVPAALQPDNSRVFNIAVKMEKRGLFPSIWIQPEAKKFGKQLKIDEWKKAGRLDIDEVARIITLTDPIVLCGGKYEFGDTELQKLSESDESVASDFEKAASMPKTWGQ